MKYINIRNGKVVEAIQYTPQFTNSMDKFLKFIKNLNIYKQELSIIPKDENQKLGAYIDVFVYHNGTEWVILPKNSYIVDMNTQASCGSDKFNIMTEEEFKNDYEPYDELNLEYNDKIDELVINCDSQNHNTYIKEFDGYSIEFDVTSDKFVRLIIPDFCDRFRDATGSRILMLTDEDLKGTN